MRRDTEGENDESKYLMQVKTKGVHMTTQISKATKNVPAQRSTEAENILGAAREDAGFEKLLKFKKGEFLIGEELVPLGTEYIAHVVGWTKCWIKFVDGEVADRKPYRVAYGEQPPEREDLGDLDRDTWPDGLDGKPADPWVLQYLVPLENLSSGEIVVFVTPSTGGRRAVADLCAAYAMRVAKKPNSGQPIIRLRETAMPTRRYGKVPRPYFEIFGWDESSDDGNETPPAVTSEGEFADEIPF